MSEWTDEDHYGDRFPHADRCRHCGGSSGPTGHTRWCVLAGAR